MTLKITKIGNSSGVILPKDLLDYLEATTGGNLTVVKTARGIELARPNDEFDSQMAQAREVMQRRRRALRELAK